MTDTHTPGQAAFVTWQREMTGESTEQAQDMWTLIGGVEQAAWEAAAQAVRTMEEPALTMTPVEAMDEIRRLVGRYFHGVDVEAYIQELRQ